MPSRTTWHMLRQFVALSIAPGRVRGRDAADDDDPVTEPVSREFGDDDVQTWGW